MKSNLIDGIGAPGRTCSQCRRDLDGKRMKICSCKFFYCYLCPICAASPKCDRYESAMRRQEVVS